MPATAPPSYPALPTPPSTAAPSSFDTRADAFLAALPAFQTDTNALAANAYANALEAASQATAAANQVALAATQATNSANSATEAAGLAAAAGAVAWVSGTSYVAGDVRYSLTNFQSYRRRTAGAGTTDPSLDSTNWAQILVTVYPIRNPSNSSPANGVTNIGYGVTLVGSAYLSLYGLTMAALQVQVSTSSDFSSFIVNTGDIAGTSTSYVITSGLTVSTTYYWRMRYKDSDGVYSEWSSNTSFTSAANLNNYIATPTATPAAFGDALEGGFYAGLIWNETAQSTSSTTIATGSKVFTVPDMSGTPIVYAGQTLEVRSRANPVNKMIGVVTSAGGTILTLNITSVGGSGTFSDWSVMAQYRVIVAPKASGENASRQYKNANTAAPAACGTLTEGRKATLAMVAADNSTVYPAAHWCNNLSIAGKTDWYLPARDELALCWRNLKPTADANYTPADRPTAATPNYMNLGSYGDTANTHGLNNNSSPTGAAHTAGTPAQVAAGKNFRTSESEAFDYSGVSYRSSSEYSASEAWHQRFGADQPGNQGVASKTNPYPVRAVRRSII